MFSSGERPASRSVSRDFAGEWLTLGAISPSLFLQSLTAIAPHGFSGRTCPAFIPLGQMRRRLLRPKATALLSSKLDKLAARPDLTLEQSLALSNLRKLISPVILTASSPPWSSSCTGSRRAFMTLNTSEWPSDAVVCSLSAMLEDSGSVPRRFYLSAKACQGILRRAAKRGKDLPVRLREALEQVAGVSAGPP